MDLHDGKPLQVSAYKRSTVLIKKKLQLRYFGLIFLGMALSAAMVALDVYYFSVGSLNPLLILKLFILLVVVFVISLFISHRVAGPIYNFEKSARIVAEGNLTHQVFLRKKDELTELQSQFNGMVQSLRVFAVKDREASQNLSRRLNDFASKLSSGISPEESRQMASQLSALSSAAAKITEDYKI